jgi:hypothetical protein
VDGVVRERTAHDHLDQSVAVVDEVRGEKGLAGVGVVRPEQFE